MSGRSSFLGQVCAEAVERVAADRAQRDDAALRDAAMAAPGAPSFAAALATAGVSVIAEIKRASPSRGPMSEIADPADLARRYARGGAEAISVLTEPRHFLGSLDDLRAVTAAVTVPVIRKDFVVDAYQLLQARAAGAAAALLIVAALDDGTLGELIAAADRVGLDTLVETHDAAEIERAVAAHRASGTPRRLILGVNARNLSTLEVDRGVIADVRAVADVPDGAIFVGESGVRGRADVETYVAAGADAVLVGEHVATAADPQAAVAALLGGDDPPGRESGLQRI